MLSSAVEKPQEGISTVTVLLKSLHDLEETEETDGSLPKTQDETIWTVHASAKRKIISIHEAVGPGLFMFTEKESKSFPPVIAISWEMSDKKMFLNA